MDDFRIQKLTRSIDRPCLVEQPADLLYLTGLKLSKGRLLILPREAILFVDGRYLQTAKEKAPCSVADWSSFYKIDLQEMYFDSGFVTYDGYLALKKGLSKTELIAKPNPVQQIRSVKEPSEIERLKDAARLTAAGIERVLECIREGISEEALSLEFELFCRKNGASGLSFEPIIAFGMNSAYPHHRAGPSLLKRGEHILIDVGAVVEEYRGDLTRIHYFGKPNEEVLCLEELVGRARDKALSRIKPGIQAGTIDQTVRDEFDRANVKLLYTHSLGHGIGLETHEFPRIRFDGEDQHVELKPGMVFTIEPGLYRPGIGGVRQEDMFVVTEEGVENLLTGQNRW